MTSGGGGSPAPAATTGTQSVQPVSADTSGSYSDLVQRANGLYDQGATAFESEKYDQGSAYFEAAAKVYAAAWKQQSTDPAVGTDFATSLFYSGQIEPALSQVDGVLAQSPDVPDRLVQQGQLPGGEGAAGRAGRRRQGGQGGLRGRPRRLREGGRAGRRLRRRASRPSSVWTRCRSRRGEGGRRRPRRPAPARRPPSSSKSSLSPVWPA